MTARTVRMLMALASVAGLVYTQSVFAEDDAKTPPAEGKHHGQGQQHGNLGEMLVKELNLTADQKPQVKAIFDEMRPKMKAIMDDQSLSKEDKGAKFKELRTASNTKIKALLTPEQQKLFDDFNKQHQHGPSGQHKAPAKDQ